MASSNLFFNCKALWLQMCLFYQIVKGLCLGNIWINTRQKVVARNMQIEVNCVFTAVAKGFLVRITWNSIYYVDREMVLQKVFLPDPPTSTPVYKAVGAEPPVFYLNLKI
mmetsp:Transcript_3793/g.7236  ORF Transcript_3793/g.7236 Transcript_3793/m.7236 type:complete len:110 (-) Transcript_3793:2608-2937(-)